MSEFVISDVFLLFNLYWDFKKIFSYVNLWLFFPKNLILLEGKFDVELIKQNSTIFI